MDTLNLNRLFKDDIHKNLCLIGTSLTEQQYSAKTFIGVGTDAKYVVTHPRVIEAFMKDVAAAKTNNSPIVAVDDVTANGETVSILTFAVDNNTLVGRAAYWQNYFINRFRIPSVLFYDDSYKDFSNITGTAAMDVTDEDKIPNNWAKIKVSTTTNVTTKLNDTITLTTTEQDVNSSKYSVSLEVAEGYEVKSVEFKGKTLKANKNNKYSITLADGDSETLTVTVEAASNPE